MTNKKVLITGAGGYIGSIATYTFLQNGYEVVGLDNFSNGYREPLELLRKKFGNQIFRYYECDLRDINSIFKKEKSIEAVIHFAAFCKVDESMKDPGKYFHNNVGGTLALLESMVKNKINKLVFSSTCAVYGEAQYVPVDEKHPTNPSNPYGESKLMVEKMIHWYGKIFNLQSVILRYFNVCGASDDGLIGDSKKPSVLLVQNAVRGALGIEPFKLTCPQVNTKDHTPIRDYINVVDLSLAHIKAFEYLSKNDQSDIFNLGTGEGNSVLEIIKTVEKETNTSINIGKSEPREGEYATMYAKIYKAKELLNWQPKNTISDSINSLVRWYNEHPRGWEK
jgi:UDP-glucose 4-epimerase